MAHNFQNHTQKPGKVLFEVLKLLLGKELSVDARNRSHHSVCQTTAEILDCHSEVAFFSSLLVREASCHRLLIKVQTVWRVAPCRLANSYPCDTV
jgi:hypothetical protein